MKKKCINVLKMIFGILSKCFDDIFLILGIILLSKGAFLIYAPGGYITLGVCFIAFAFFIAKKGG